MRASYFNEALMSVNLVLRVVPKPLTTAMIAKAMPAAINPYSIAVAPDSSDKNLRNVRFKSASYSCFGFGIRTFPYLRLRQLIIFNLSLFPGNLTFIAVELDKKKIRRRRRCATLTRKPVGAY